MNRTAAEAPVLLVVALALLPAAAAAQVFEGRVLDDADARSVPTALVRLVDRDGDDRGVTAADSSGFYRLVAPEPGVYRLVAERVGYEPFETPLLDAARADAVYAIDLLVRRAPIPIRGLEVSAERAEQQVRLVVGMHPRALRHPPIFREKIQTHVEHARDLVGLMRWEAGAGITVIRGDPSNGPCFLVRMYSCLPVYLNGFPLVGDLVTLVPLDMLEAIVLLRPKESIQYPGGAVLLYTEAWLR